MTSVDTGWITDERPHPTKMRLAERGLPRAARPRRRRRPRLRPDRPRRGGRGRARRVPQGLRARAVVTEPLANGWRRPVAKPHRVRGAPAIRKVRAAGTRCPRAPIAHADRVSVRTNGRAALVISPTVVASWRLTQWLARQHRREPRRVGGGHGWPPPPSSDVKRPTGAAARATSCPSGRRRFRVRPCASPAPERRSSHPAELWALEGRQAGSRAGHRGRSRRPRHRWSGRGGDRR